MKTNIQFLAAVVPFLMAAGCATDHEPVYFASAAKLPATPPDAYAPAKGLPKADERRIQMVVFGYLLDRHFWDDANHTAIFVQADEWRQAERPDFRRCRLAGRTFHAEEREKAVHPGDRAVVGTHGARL